MKNYFIIVLLFVISSCSKYPDDVEKALKYAGENRPELEKVLMHYEKNNEEEKLEAAYFLIKNMPGLQTASPKVFEKYRSIYEALDRNRKRGKAFYKTGIISRKIDSCFASGISKTKVRPTYSEDIKTITSKDLISGIDNAFWSWKTFNKEKTVDYNTFLEYILPYRITEVQTKNYHTIFHDEYKAIQDSVKKKSQELAQKLILKNIDWLQNAQHIRK